MATTGRAAGSQHSDHDEPAAAAGQQVAVQLAVQGWAVTSPAVPARPPIPTIPLSRLPDQPIPQESPSRPARAKERT
jgi:hypothetical protein